MIRCFGPSFGHSISETGYEGRQNPVAPGDLEENVRALGQSQYFRFNFFHELLTSARTCQIGLLLKIPQVVSGVAEGRYRHRIGRSISRITQHMEVESPLYSVTPELL